MADPRLDRCLQMLAEERRARLALEQRVAKQERELDEGLEILSLMTELPQQTAALTQRLSAVEASVKSAEQLFDAGTRQADAVEAQLHRLEAAVCDDLGLSVGGPAASVRKGGGSPRQRGRSPFRGALRSISAEKLESSILAESTPERSAGRQAAAVSAAAASSQQAMAASMSDVMGTETAEAICEAFSGVIKDLRLKVESLDAAPARPDASPAVSALQQSHTALRRDLAVQTARSEKLGEGVSHVLDQLQQVSAFAGQAASLSSGQEDTLGRVRWLEETLGKGQESTAWGRAHEQTHWLFTQLDQKVTESLSKFETSHSAIAKEPLATRAEIEETNKAIDDISNAVADDLASLEAKNVELSEGLQSFGGVKLQEIMDTQFAVDEVLAEQLTKMARVEKVLKDQLDLEASLADSLDEMRASEEAQRMKRAENLFRRAMGKMLNATTASCFEAWKTMAAENKRQRVVVKKVVNRFRNRAMNSAFASWAGAARSARKHKQHEAWQAQEQAIQNVLSRLDPDGDGVVDQDEFTAWAKEQALRAELMAKQVNGALAELRESQAIVLEEQAEAVDELRDAIDQAVNQEELAERLDRIEQTVRREISSNVGGLSEQLVGDRQEMHAEMDAMKQQAAFFSAEEKTRRAEEIFRRALGRMKNMSSSKIFAAWHTMAKTRKGERLVARKVMKRMTNLNLSGCFGTWAGAVRALRNAKAQDLYNSQQKAIQDCLARLDPDRDGVVDQDEFTSWAHEQALRVELWEKRLEEALGELTRKVDQAVDEDTFADRLVRVEDQMEAQLSGAATSLAGEIGEMRALTEEMAQKERKRRIEGMARRAMGRMKNLSSSKVFAAWLKATQEGKRGKQMARKAISRFRNAWMSQCYNQWAGAVRISRKQRAEEIHEEQTSKLQAVLARLDPDGDGVVDQGEFTQWAQMQALRAEAWEMKLTAAMAELSGLKKQNEKHADEGALNSLADEVVAKMAEVEKTFTTKQREHDAALETLTATSESILATTPSGLQEWQEGESRRVFEQLRPLLSATVEEIEKTIQSLEEGIIVRTDELDARGAADTMSLQRALAGLESHINARERAVDQRMETERTHFDDATATMERRLSDKAKTVEQRVDALQGTVRSVSRDLKDVEQKAYGGSASPRGSARDEHSDLTAEFIASRPDDAITAAISDVRRSGLQESEIAVDEEQDEEQDAGGAEVSSYGGRSSPARSARSGGGGDVAGRGDVAGQLRQSVVRSQATASRAQAIAEELLERMEDVEERANQLEGESEQRQQEMETTIAQVLSFTASSSPARTLKPRRESQQMIRAMPSAVDEVLKQLKEQRAAEEKRMDEQDHAGEELPASGGGGAAVAAGAAAVGEMVAAERVTELEASLSKLTITVGQQSCWMEDVVGDLDSKVMLKHVSIESRLGRVESSVGDITRKLEDSQAQQQMQVQMMGAIAGEPGMMGAIRGDNARGVGGGGVSRSKSRVPEGEPPSRTVSSLSAVSTNSATYLDAARQRVARAARPLGGGMQSHSATALTPTTVQSYDLGSLGPRLVRNTPTQAQAAPAAAFADGAMAMPSAADLLFQTLDTDGDGVITRDEMAAGLGQRRV